ncbi:hypothetical protein C8R45DRAFT_926961 [Mycena sanguinolenta]|nr:hypothetical protein C8R45DRAFT_926961 [Mycena sanguinolenta]
MADSARNEIYPGNIDGKRTHQEATSRMYDLEGWREQRRTASNSGFALLCSGAPVARRSMKHLVHLVPKARVGGSKHDGQRTSRVPTADEYKKSGTTLVPRRNAQTAHKISLSRCTAPGGLVFNRSEIAAPGVAIA